LANLTIRQKRWGSALVSVALCAALGSVGYNGISRLAEANSLAAVYSEAIRFQVETDMLHDALNSDVQAALLAGVQKDKARHADAVKDTAQHTAELRAHLVSLKALDIDAGIKVALNEADAPLAAYVTTATELVSLAFDNVDDALAKRDKFDARFQELEKKLESLSNVLLAQTQKTKEASLAAASSQKTLMIGILVVALPVLILLLGLTAHTVNLRLNALRTFADELASGEADLTKRLDTSGSDEVAETAKAFNSFLGLLHQVVVDVRCESNGVAECATRLASDALILAEHSSRQSDVAEGTAANVEEMTVSVSSVADSAEQARKLATNSVERTRTGTQILGELISEVSDVEVAVKAIADTADEYIRNIAQITDMTMQVKDIADQTNVLALNAAIEAARAGEQGRGFAVVADAVRKLAERSAKSAGEIDKVTSHLGACSTGVEQAIRRGLDALDVSRASAQRVIEALDHADQSAAQVNEQVDEIARSVIEQRAASQGIAVSVEQIAQMAEESNAALQRSKEASNGMRDASSKLLGLVNRFKVS